MAVDEDLSVVGNGVEMNNCPLPVAETRKKKGTLQPISARRTEGRRNGDYIEELAVNIPLPIAVQINDCAKGIQRFHLCHRYPRVPRKVELHSSGLGLLQVRDMAGCCLPENFIRASHSGASGGRFPG